MVECTLTTWGQESQTQDLSLPAFLRATPPSVEFEQRTGEQTDGKPPMGVHPLREHQLGMALSCCQSKGDYVTHTHAYTHICHLKMSWHLALQRVRG